MPVEAQLGEGEQHTSQLVVDVLEINVQLLPGVLVVCLIIVSTECLTPDALTMWESMLHQTLHVHVASDTQLQSYNWPKLFVMMSHYPAFSRTKRHFRLSDNWVVDTLFMSGMCIVLLADNRLNHGEYVHL